MIIASLVVLGAAAACFFTRLVIGPSLSDRVVAIDGLLVVGVSAIGVEAVRSGVGSFLPVAVVVTLVGFISTAAAAKFIERRDDVIGEALILLGCVLTLLAGIGVLRFGDVFQRMHALTKGSSLGLVLVLVGGALVLPGINDVTSLALAAVLQVLTLPVGANMISIATYRASVVPRRIDTIDELDERQDDADAD